ncbi:MAG: hypothetical protein QOK35_1433 [Pseudonocardiales bacterium]|nr:hypothetical protein [Pseudonocardiales bacterium]
MSPRSPGAPAAGSRAAGTRRSRLLVSLAAVAAAGAAVLLALLVAAIMSGRGAGSAAAHGLAASGAAVLALGLLVLARAGAVGRTDPVRARGLCARCTVGGVFAVVAVLVAGGIAVVSTRSAAPVWGATVGGVLLVPLVVLGTWQRAALRPARRPSGSGSGPPAARRPRSGGGGESEPGGGADAR